MRILWATVRAEAGGVRQPEGELYHGRDSREGRQRQPSRVRAAHLPHTDHRGGRPQSAQARATGPARSASYSILTEQTMSTILFKKNRIVTCIHRLTLVDFPFCMAWGFCKFFFAILRLVASFLSCFLFLLQLAFLLRRVLQFLNCHQDE